LLALRSHLRLPQAVRLPGLQLQHPLAPHSHRQQWEQVHSHQQRNHQCLRT
ncbi:hypothetical protein AVEN_154265-1, partial [Araneus ventricosus]